MFDKVTIREIVRLAHELGPQCEPEDLLAIAEVESAGVAGWNVNGKMLPAIRFEGHYFYKRLSGAKRKRAVDAGLASPVAGKVKNPNSYARRYALLQRAIEIDENAALESTSWGLGQVMGAHWKKLGYGNVKSLVADAKSGIVGQIAIMGAYIKAFHLLDELARNDWLAFALAYNGPAARKNNYPAKIRIAYNRYKKMNLEAAADDQTRDWQNKLKALGYLQTVDGNPKSIATRTALRSFQRDNDLRPDGMYGPMTEDVLDKAFSRKDSKLRGLLAKIGGGGIAGGAGGTKLVDLGQIAIDQSQTLSYYLGDISWMNYILAAVMVTGVVLLAYGSVKKLFSSEEEPT